MIKISKNKTCYKVPECKCPSCGEIFDGGTQIAGDSSLRPQGPWPGAWSLCFACGAILVYGKDLLLQIPTQQKWATLLPEQLEFMKLAQRFIREHHEHQKHTNS